MALYQTVLHRLERSNWATENIALFHIIECESDRGIGSTGNFGGKPDPPPLALRCPGTRDVTRTRQIGRLGKTALGTSVNTFDPLTCAGFHRNHCDVLAAVDQQCGGDRKIPDRLAKSDLCNKCDRTDKTLVR